MKSLNEDKETEEKETPKPDVNTETSSAEMNTLDAFMASLESPAETAPVKVIARTRTHRLKPLKVQSKRARARKRVYKKARGWCGILMVNSECRRR